MQVSAYLNFNGQCEEAFQLYEKLLGGRIEGPFRYGGSPMETGMPAEWRDKIMHTTLIVGSGALQGADAPPGYYQPSAGYSVSLMLGDPAEAERIFKGLAEGGQVKMPLETTFWSPKFGMLVDRFGIPWMINCEAPK